MAPREGPLPLGQVARSPGQKLEAPPEPAEHGIGRQELDPRRCQLYGERQAVETGADLGYRRGILVGEGEVRLGGPRPLYEEPDRLVLGEGLEAGQPLRVRDRERRHRVLVLAVDPERDAAGGEDLEAEGGQQLARQRGGFQHLLEVVQHQQKPFVLEVVLHALDERLVPALPHVERLRDGRDDQRGVGEGGERHEEDAVLELIQEISRRLQRQAGLARAPRTGEGKEAHLGSHKPPSDLLHLPLASDERGGLHGQVVRAALERPQRREIGGQIRRQELEDALGAGEVLQAVFPQIPQFRVHRQVIPHQILGR